MLPAGTANGTSNRVWLSVGVLPCAPVARHNQITIMYMLHDKVGIKQDSVFTEEDATQHGVYMWQLV